MAQWVEAAVNPDDLSSTPGYHRVDGIGKRILSSGPLTPMHMRCDTFLHTYKHTNIIGFSIFTLAIVRGAQFSGSCLLVTLCI